MTAPLRIGVIGVGRFGERHLSAYARQEVEVVAVADRDRERARSVAERFGVARWFEDGAELVADCRPDGAVARLFRAARKAGGDLEPRG